MEKILQSGMLVLTVMDICGAMSLKTHFSNVTTIYIKRDKRELLADLLNKPLSLEEKVSRIIALESEEKNAEICDYVVNQGKSYADAAKEILDSLFKKKSRKKK